MTIQGFEVVAKLFGRCRQCEVITFAISGGQPVEKHLCRPVRQSWSVKVERRASGRA